MFRQSTVKPGVRQWAHISWITIPTLILFTLATAYQFVAFRSLLIGSGESIPIDIRLRWIESNLLMEGKDSHTWGHPDGEFPPRLRWQQSLGGGYPPWATALGLILAPPVSWPAARTRFAMLNLGGLMVISAWAYSVGAKRSQSFALFLVAAALACAPAAICISYGQYAVLITAALVVAIVDFERNRKLTAGLALGLGLIKPQLAAMAAVMALIRRQYLASFIAGLVVLAGCAVMWVMTGIDPVTALRDSQHDAKKFAAISVNPLTEWLLPVLGFERTTLSLGFSFLAVGSLIAWLSPTQVRMSVLVSVSVIICMFWSYRRPYDGPLLIIPLVLLLDAAAQRKGILHVGIALLFGVSLWLPIRNEQWGWNAVQMFDLITWIAGGALLLVHELRHGRQSLAIRKRPIHSPRLPPKSLHDPNQRSK